MDRLFCVLFAASSLTRTLDLSVPKNTVRGSATATVSIMGKCCHRDQFSLIDAEMNDEWLLSEFVVGSFVFLSYRAKIFYFPLVERSLLQAFR